MGWPSRVATFMADGAYDTGAVYEAAQEIRRWTARYGVHPSRRGSSALFEPCTNAASRRNDPFILEKQIAVVGFSSIFPI